jgi:hypothetical protein
MTLFLIAIPTVKNGGNHTIGFADSAATIVSHNACLDVSKALASTGVRVLVDDEFFAKVWMNSLWMCRISCFVFLGRENFQGG